MKPKHLIILILCMVYASTQAQEICGNEDFVRLHKQGLSQYAKKQYAEAIASLELANRYCPKCPDCKAKVAVCRAALATVATKSIAKPKPKSWRSKYQTIGDFNYGLAYAQRGNKWGYVDESGREVVPCLYDDVFSFTDGLGRIQFNKKYGFVNTNGDFAIPPMYDYASSFSNDYAIVSRASKYGLITTNGKEAIPLQFDDMSLKAGNVYRTVTNSKESWITADGVEYTDLGNFSDGLAWSQKKGESNYGFINEQGQEAIKAEYSTMFRFYNGKSMVKKTGTSTWFFIDKQGRTVLENRTYDEIGNSNYGICPVKKNGKWGYIDTETWEEIFPCIYEHASSFSNGKALVTQSVGGVLFGFGLDKKCYFLYKDKTKPLEATNYSYFASHFQENLLIVIKTVDDKTLYGFVDENWNEVIPCKYDNVKFFADGKSKVTLNDKTFYINKTGICVKDCP
jgi:hypothetical protein